VAGGPRGTRGVFPFGEFLLIPGVGVFFANASGLLYSVGGEVDMSYLRRSGSAEGEGQTVFGGGRGGAGGALSFPFSWRVGLVLLVGARRVPLEECVACCVKPGHWGGKEA